MQAIEFTLCLSLSKNRANLGLFAGDDTNDDMIQEESLSPKGFWRSRHRFKSCFPHQISTIVLIRNHRAFSILVDIYTAI